VSDPRLLKTVAPPPLWGSPLARGITLAALAGVFTLPFWGTSYLLDVATRTGIAVIAALGLNILTGFTGLISLGNAAFMAIGGYAAGYLATKTGLAPLLAIPAGGLASALLGMVIGIPSLRLKGLYLAMATLAAHFIVEFFIVHADSVTGGVSGMSIPSPRLGSIVLDSDKKLLPLVWLMVTGAALFAANLFRTRAGRAFIAIRDQEVSAAVMGIDVFRYKLLAFGVSSFYVGTAGALLACQTKLISPETFPFSLAIDSLAMIIIGGLGSIAGSVFGAVFLTLLPELLRVTTTSLSGVYPGLVMLLASLKELVFGILIIVFLIAQPHGIAAWWRTLTTRRGRNVSGSAATTLDTGGNV